MRDTLRTGFRNRYLLALDLLLLPLATYLAFVVRFEGLFEAEHLQAAGAAFCAAPAVDFADFCVREAHWLEDFALYSVLKIVHHGRAWTAWPKGERNRNRRALASASERHAAALAQADLGIAVGSGSDVAVEAGDITLIGDDLLGVPTAIMLARRTYRTIVQNLFWAFGYNVALVPLAAWGKVSPMLAALAMGASSVSVVSNALRLKRVKPITGDQR